MLLAHLIGDPVLYRSCPNDAKPINKSLAESDLKQTNVGKTAKGFCGKEAHLPVKMAAEYRAMAEECFRWAREAQANAVRVSLEQLAQVWLDAASKLEDPPPTQTEPVPNEPRKTLGSAGWRAME